MAALKKFWEKLTSRFKKPAWMTWQSVLVIGVILFFIVVMIWSEPLGKLVVSATHTPSHATPTPTVQPGTPTPIPEELRETPVQTNGIILGSVILVLIIVIGAVTRMFFHGKNSNKAGQ